MNKKILISIVLFTFGCREGVDVTPSPPVITDQYKCSSACARLQKLSCEDGNPIDMKKSCSVTYDCVPGQLCINNTCHVTCEDFCIDTQNAGVWLDPGCVSKINKCSEIDSCPIPKKKLKLLRNICVKC